MLFRCRLSPVFTALLVGMCLYNLNIQTATLPSRVSAEDQQTDQQTSVSAENTVKSVEEARARARLLHETLHGTLQVMHRDYFRKDSGLPIPSQALEDVFIELDRGHNIQLRWLAINTPAMNLDHSPRGKIEEDAVAKLKSGALEFESVDAEAFRFVAPIRLSSTCLSCHVPRRTDNSDRMAGLMITIPLTQSKKSEQ